MNRFLHVLFCCMAMLVMAAGAKAQVPGKGYYRIKGVQNGRYVEVTAPFMSAPNVMENNKYHKPGTVFYLDAENDGKVNVLRSQGVPYPNYFDIILTHAQEWIYGEMGTEPTEMKKAYMYLEPVAEATDVFYAKTVIPSIDDLVEQAAEAGVTTTADEVWTKGIEMSADELSGLGIPANFIVMYLKSLAKPGDSYYLTDDGGSFGGVTSAGVEAKGNLAKWVVEPVETDNDAAYFGVNATIEKDGKYYATLYTDFPYTHEADMKAYYVDRIADGKTQLVEIVGSQVPAQTPVVLECTYADAEDNRLTPVGEMVADNDGKYDYPADFAPVSGNLLKGVFFNETASVFALEVKDEKLGFTSAQDMMVGNRAYTEEECVIEVPAIDLAEGYYRIQGVKNKKYTEVLMQFLSAPIVADNNKYTRAGTVMYLNAENDGTVNLLRSQGIPYPNYFNPTLAAGEQWVLDQINASYTIDECPLVIMPAETSDGQPAYYATITLPSLDNLCALAAENGLEVTPEQVWKKGVDLVKDQLAEQFGIADIFVQAYLYPLVPGNRYYLTDDGGSFGCVDAAGLAAKGDLAVWFIEPVDEENYFGVNCLAGTSDGKYGDVKQGDYWYTTAYFDFPYYLSDNNGAINTEEGVVNAYIVTGFNEYGDAVCESIGKAVPEQTPVLLECTSDDAQVNKLFPTVDEVPAVSGNILKGNEYLQPCDWTINNKYFFNVEWNSEWAEKVRTLDVKKWNDEDGWMLGFYAFDYTNFLNGNKAYLWVEGDVTSDYIKRQQESGVNGSLISLDDDTNSLNKVVSTMGQDGNIYDLQGRKVNRPFSGIFIINGKKVAIK